jgi:hypothetical protein
VPASYQLIVKWGEAKREKSTCMKLEGHGSQSRGNIVNTFPPCLLETRLQALQGGLGVFMFSPKSLRSVAVTPRYSRF